MKKILSIVLCVVAVFLLAVVCSGAETKNWVAGNGFNIIEKHSPDSEMIQVSQNSPVTITENADGTVKVTHGGYYQDGKNWGGVASVNKYDIKDLSVTVRFDKVPVVDPGHDCWAYIGVLEEPQMFQVGAIPENRGFVNLIRFSTGNWEIYDGITAFKQVERSEENAMFAIKSGDVVTVTFKEEGEGLYKVSLVNGENEYAYSTTNTYDLGSVFADGKAHIVVSASCLNSAENDFEYTITNISNTPSQVETVDALEKYRQNDPEPGVVKVYVNDNRVSFDVAPIIEDGRTLVPVRAIFEALGAELTWDDKTKTATAVAGSDSVAITIGSKELVKNGEVVATLDVPAKIVDSRTLVPARAIAEAFACKVNWVSETKTVVVNK